MKIYGDEMPGHLSALRFQQVGHKEMASASSMEMALCAFSELVMLGIAAYTADPASYRWAAA